MDSEIPKKDLDPPRQMDRVFGRCLCNIAVDGINYTLDYDRSYGTRLLAFTQWALNQRFPVISHCGRYLQLFERHITCKSSILWDGIDCVIELVAIT